jgi:hypothetical protein
MKNNTLNWLGPFKWYDKYGRSIFQQKQINEYGLYMFTIKKKDGYLIHYIGETGRSFESRFTEHISCYLSGRYKIFAPDDFSNGDLKNVIWNVEKGEYKMNEFLLKHDFLCKDILKFLSVMELFLSPIEVSEGIRKRIEGAIATMLKENPAAKAFLDVKRHSHKKPKDDVKFIEMKFPGKIIGIENEKIEI